MIKQGPLPSWAVLTFLLSCLWVFPSCGNSNNSGTGGDEDAEAGLDTGPLPTDDGPTTTTPDATGGSDVEAQDVATHDVVTHDVATDAPTSNTGDSAAE